MGGASLGSHLEQLEKTLGKSVEGNENEEELPEGLAYIWDVFCELANARSGTGFGPGTISFTEIANWCKLKGIELCNWEVDAIRALDVKWLENWNARSRRTKSPD